MIQAKGIHVFCNSIICIFNCAHRSSSVDYDMAEVMNQTTRRTNPYWNVASPLGKIEAINSIQNAFAIL